MSHLNGLPNVTMLALDVVKTDDIEAAVEIVTKQTGGTLNYLVNNAGRNHFMPILDEDLDMVRNPFEVNFYGPLSITQAFAALLIKAKGMAVYVTSISGYINVPFMGTYAASKRSLELAAETLRLELAPFGVDVLEVVTGGVKTRGQTYFGDFKLPDKSLYKNTEDVIASRAQGKDGLPRMEAAEYAAAAADQITSRTTGRFWYGNNAESTRMSTTATAVPQSAMGKDRQLPTRIPRSTAAGSRPTGMSTKDQKQPSTSRGLRKRKGASRDRSILEGLPADPEVVMSHGGPRVLAFQKDREDAKDAEVNTVYSSNKNLILWSYPLVRNYDVREQKLFAISSDTRVLFIKGTKDWMAAEIIFGPVRREMKANTWHLQEQKLCNAIGTTGIWLNGDPEDNNTPWKSEDGTEMAMDWDEKRGEVVWTEWQPLGDMPPQSTIIHDIAGLD
ncbi:hypothetical protein INS49_012049 [Diaporthe citri]|uniref:uncharacterized protein n=1 Tax=Diaporthe citri TaxID=83186 RepID=UPI001C80EE68|nr:uncharacterized protein INS49_012049 [Diaporthe citri]KAG6358532.1 hypothetical protein INS49_012049 [Diaporthe citri]